VNESVGTLDEASVLASTGDSTEVPIATAEPVEIKENKLQLAHVPSFEEAAETYKAMMQKYSPRPAAATDPDTTSRSSSTARVAVAGPEKGATSASPPAHASSKSGRSKIEARGAEVEPGVDGESASAEGALDADTDAGHGFSPVREEAAKPKQRVKQKHSIAKELTKLVSICRLKSI
jgi:hypothetical protein